MFVWGEGMPPHCDTMDGPVVKAAKRALKTGNVNLILPWVPKKAEDELKKTFKKLFARESRENKLLDSLTIGSLKLLCACTERAKERHILA